MNDQFQEATKEDLASLLMEALVQHQTFTRELLEGQGFDRHLLGLRQMIPSLQQSKDHDDMDDMDKIELFFHDNTYKEASHFRLSTSQVGIRSSVVSMFSL